MGRARIFGVLACGLMVTGALTQAGGSAQAESGPYSGWTHREDARSPVADSIESLPGSGLHMYSFNNQVSITSDVSTGDSDLGGIEFLPPVGQTLRTGVTYSVGGALRQPTSMLGQVIAYRDGTMCGRSEDDLASGGYFATTPAVGWFHIDDIEYVDGSAVSFAATYEINCQYLDGPAGFEGSISVNAPMPPSPVPTAPATPGPITNLKAKNTNPDGGGTNTTTLTWTSPATYGDITIDMVQSADKSLFPSLVADYFTQQWRGRASSYYDGDVEFMDVRTYRVVARGASGRLSTPALITVMGSRLAIPVTTRTIMIGQKALFSGRLSKALGVEQPNADPMSGPALPGRTVVMCQQATAHYVDGGCNQVDSAKTSAEGRFTLSATPVANSYYSVMLPSSSDLVGNRSFVLTTGVAPQTDLRAPSDETLRTEAVTGTATARAAVMADADISSDASARSVERKLISTTRTSTASSITGVRRGAIIHFTTSRARRGSLGVARLQHLSGGRWHTVLTKRLRPGTDRLRLPFREYTRGLHSFRVLKPADSHHVNGRSHVLRIRVR
jgi:hypothetical protein